MLKRKNRAAYKTLKPKSPSANQPANGFQTSFLERENRAHANLKPPNRVMLISVDKLRSSMEQWSFERGASERETKHGASAQRTRPWRVLNGEHDSRRDRAPVNGAVH